jgi:hypothetical protein
MYLIREVLHGVPSAPPAEASLQAEAAAVGAAVDAADGSTNKRSRDDAGAPFVATSAAQQVASALASQGGAAAAAASAAPIATAGDAFSQVIAKHQSSIGKAGTKAAPLVDVTNTAAVVDNTMDTE